MVAKIRQLPPLLHLGQRYSATYVVRGGTLVVFHGPLTKRATLNRFPAGPLAERLLYEIVVLDGRGVPDHPLPPSG